MEAERKKLHNRTIACAGFERADGLWDIEATLTDTRTHSIHNHERGEVVPGEPVHEMMVRIAVDLDMVIHEVEVQMRHTPFGLCRTAADIMDNLVGLQIGSGWMRQARERITRTESCTHVMELLGPLSTTAYQTMHWAIEERENARPTRNPPAILDQCKSLSRDSTIVKVMWPEFHTDN